MAPTGTVDRRPGPARPGRVALPPADPGLPDLALLDPILLATRLGAVRTRLRYLEYRPGRSLLLQAEVLTTADTVGEALVHVTPDGSRVRWLPDDPALPLLAGSAAELRTALVAAGVADPGPAPAVRRLAYIPGRQVTLRLGDLVLKSYADEAAFDAAWTALTTVHRCGGLPTPAPLMALQPLRTAVQEFCPGHPVDGALAVALAPRAGAALRRWQQTRVLLGAVLDPRTQLLAAERAVTLVEAVLPEQGRRARRQLQRLQAGAPHGLDLVPAHGDFSCGQLIDRSATTGGTARSGTGLAVVDVDTAAMAPAATDPAAYAANLTSGRVGDAARTAAALDGLLDGLGHRPAELDWHLAVALLRRADRPFRRLKKDWPDRTVRILDGVQDAA